MLRGSGSKEDAVSSSAMATAHINIGSNLGDRAALLGRAVAAVSTRFNVTAVSDVHESEPWGYGSSNRFLNVGVNLDVDDGMGHAVCWRLLSEYRTQ